MQFLMLLALRNHAARDVAQVFSALRLRCAGYDCYIAFSNAILVHTEKGCVVVLLSCEGNVE